MLDLAVSLCKNVIDFIVTNKKIQNDKKIVISQLLNQISEVLQNTAESLKKNEYPHMNCSVLHTLSNNFMESVSEYMLPEDADKLSETLKMASEVEKHFSVREEPDTIPQIERAAGEFKAMSLLTYL